MRIVLVGCGARAVRAHLPALAAALNRVSLVLCDLPEKKEMALAAAVEFGLIDVGFVEAPSHPDDFDRPPWSQRGFHNLDGLIVASPTITHMPYVSWALHNSIPILVDKPLSVRPSASVDSNAALGIVEDFQSAMTLCSSGVFAGISAQRRYHPIYRLMGSIIHDTYVATRQPVTFVQAMTNDGLWGDIHNYQKDPVYDPVRAGGGKLINTGYHLLDIVPWLMRHAQDGRACSDVERISAALVSTAVIRPHDIVHLEPSRNLGGESEVASSLNELNASVQISFLDSSERIVAIFQMGALHEGISQRAVSNARQSDQEAVVSGRTKQDFISISQGPVSALWLRRIARLSKLETDRPGGDGHVELLHAQNTSATGGGSSLSQFAGHYVDTDSEPTREWLAALKAPVGEQAMASPLQDHAIATKLLAAAYHAAVTGGASTVLFDPRDWRAPPMFETWLTRST